MTSLETGAISPLLERLRAQNFNISPEFNGVEQRADRAGRLSGAFIGRAHTLASGVHFTGVWYDYADDEAGGSWETNLPVSPEERQALEQCMAEDRAREAAAREALHEEIAQLSAAQLENAIDRGLTPYLTRKKVDRLYGCRIDPDDGSTLLIPLRDIHGKLWGSQRILADGQKLIALRHQGEIRKGTKKRGNFHVLGDIYPQGEMLICEGFATAASIHMAFNGSKTVICAVDAGNLLPVGQALREKYPQALLIYCADDDRWKPEKGNKGRTSAEAAARATGGTVRYPVFQAISTKPTDFNDLHCLEGLPAVLACLERAATYSEFPLAPLAWGGTAKKPMPPSAREVAMAMLGYFGEDLICQGHDFFRYTGTHWQEVDEAGKKGLFRLALHLYGGVVSVSLVQQALEMLRNLCPTPPGNLFAPTAHCANFLNGTLHLTRTIHGGDAEFGLTFRLHARKDFLTWVTPLDYPLERLQPGYRAPMNDLWEDLLREAFEGDPDTVGKRASLQEMAGAMLVPCFPQMFFLTGVSGSRKSTIAKVLLKILTNSQGETPHVSGIDPADMEKFHLEGMINKLVNANTDIDDKKPLPMGTLKRLEDRLPMPVNRKGLKIVNVLLPGVHIYCANDLPPNYEKSKALVRRLKIIQFLRDLTNLPGARDIKKYEELVWARDPGAILEFALAGLDRLVVQGGHFSKPESSLRHLQEWQDRNDPLAHFLADVARGTVECTVPVSVGLEHRIRRSQLWKEFSTWMKDSTPHDRFMSRTRFYEGMRHRGFRETILDGYDCFVGIGAPHSGENSPSVGSQF